MDPQQPQQQPVQSQEPQQPSQPLQQPMQQQQQQPPRRTHKKLALTLLIGPSALFVGAIILYAVANFMFANTSGDTSLYGDPSPMQTIANVTLFIVGIVAFMTWLPGIIIGIILLARKK